MNSNFKNTLWRRTENEDFIFDAIQIYYISIRREQSNNPVSGFFCFLYYNLIALIYVLIINYRLLSGKEYRSHQSVFYERETGPSEQL